MKDKVYLVEMDIRSTASVFVFADSREEACDIAYDKYLEDPEDSDFDWESTTIEGPRVVEEYDAEE